MDWFSWLAVGIVSGAAAHHAFGSRLVRYALGEEKMRSGLLDRMGFDGLVKLKASVEAEIEKRRPK